MLYDLRLAFRILVKNWVFTLIAVLTLGVGIGSATVVFSAVNALFLRPLPLIQGSEQLLHFSQTDTSRGSEDIGINYADFRDLSEQMTTIDGAWVFSDRTVILEGTAEPERLLGTELSPRAFSLMGVEPVLGRNFRPEDDAAAAPPVVLLSHALWQRRFGGAADVLGTTVILNGQAATVVGVMPAGWAYPEISDLWTPLRPEPEKATIRGSFWLGGAARLKPGVSLEQAQAEATTVMAALARQYPASNDGISVRFRPIREEAIQEAGRSTQLLFGAVLFVFLIACLNVANLLLARASSRSKEIAVRLALGAERGRLIRQLLTESTLLGLLGGVAGMLFALWGLDLMVAAIPVEIPFWLRFEFDGRVFAFVLALSLLSAGVFGIVPSLRSTRPSLINDLKEGGRTSEDTSLQTHRLRNTLVVAEVAIALILLVGATLLLRSFINLKNVDPGYQRENVLTFRTGFPASMADAESEVPRQFFTILEERLSQLPGVEAAGLSGMHLPNHGMNISGFLMEGQPDPKAFSNLLLAENHTVTPGFFDTVRIPLVAGRMFQTSDTLKAPQVTIVDVRFAETHFGGVDQALGRRFRLSGKPGEPEPLMEVVGVVRNILTRPDKTHQLPAFYRPVSQVQSNFMTAMIRTRGEPMAYAETARQTVLGVNRSIPIYHVMTLDQAFIRSVWTRQFFGYLFTASGVIALFLACIGIYGVMTYNVTQRTQELGMRMALGAQPAEVMRMVVKHGFNLVCTGLLLGLVGAYFAVQLLTGTLYGVSPHDPPTFALVPLLLTGVALVACYLPTRRITRIDPNAAMRCE